MVEVKIVLLEEEDDEDAVIETPTPSVSVSLSLAVAATSVDNKLVSRFRKASISERKRKRILLQFLATTISDQHVPWILKLMDACEYEHHKHPSILK